ncbi:uncharacterized protein [Amphiura filiformis]|uniref:uncharacterized protein n=1 Tax=Amphiura filiformis TaxID=82378 RepID=UPI003B227A44
MRCKKCGVDKLSREFPPFTLSVDCYHPPLHCLRCVMSYWNLHQQCSQCNLDVPETSLTLRKCRSIIEALFPEVHPTTDTEGEPDTTSKGSQTITVTRLDGEATEVAYNPTKTVIRVKESIQQVMKIAISKQRLVYNGDELEEFSFNNTANTLSTYGIKPGATIHLIVLLYAVPSTLNNVVFDLYWGFPSDGLDYLDASALIYNGLNYCDVADWENSCKARGAIFHSGDMIDETNNTGHHIIKVHLNSLPDYVTHVFFALSAWDSPSISRFKNPSLRFYEESNPRDMLCKDETKKAGHRQAIIMCSLTKRGGQWFVHENGKLSNGNARYYSPLRKTARAIVATMGH